MKSIGCPFTAFFLENNADPTVAISTMLMVMPPQMVKRSRSFFFSLLKTLFYSIKWRLFFSYPVFAVGLKLLVKGFKSYVHRKRAFLSDRV